MRKKKGIDGFNETRCAVVKHERVARRQLMSRRITSSATAERSKRKKKTHKKNKKGRIKIIG
jgi:hypothetical protein